MLPKHNLILCRNYKHEHRWLPTPSHKECRLPNQPQKDIRLHLSSAITFKYILLWRNNLTHSLPLQPSKDPFQRPCCPCAQTQIAYTTTCTLCPCSQARTLSSVHAAHALRPRSCSQLPALSALAAKQGPFPASMLPMRSDPDRVHNYLHALPLQQSKDPFQRPCCPCAQTQIAYTTT